MVQQESRLNVADNSTATLSVDCGSITSYDASVQSEAVTFDNVTLTDNSSCTTDNQAPTTQHVSGLR